MTGSANIQLADDTRHQESIIELNVNENRVPPPPCNIEFFNRGFEGTREEDLIRYLKYINGMPISSKGCIWFL